MAEKQSRLHKFLKKSKMLGLAVAMTLGAVGCTQSNSTPKRASSGDRPTVSHRQTVRSNRSTKATSTQEWTIPSADENLDTQGESYQQNSQDEGVLQMGVLMPNAGESVQDYEARRARMEKANRILHQKMAKVSYKHWLDLKNSGANKRLVDAAAKAYADHQYEAGLEYVSYYSELGQGKLKYGSAYGTTRTSQRTRNGGYQPNTGRQSTTAMNAVNAKRGGYVDDF